MPEVRNWRWGAAAPHREAPDSKPAAEVSSDD
jgi:hypothetical protein